MPEHSPEPWRTYECHAIRTYAEVFLHPPGEDEDKIVLTGPHAQADAMRLVACVNACKGVPTAVLESLPNGPTVVKWARNQTHPLPNK